MAELTNEAIMATAESLRRLNGTTDALTDSEKELLQAQKAATNALIGSAKALGKGLLGGTGGFAKYTDTLGKATSALGQLANSIPGVSTAADGAAAAIEALGHAMDEAFASFQALAKVGAIGADGISGLNKQVLESGLTIGQFTKLTGQSAGALARFSGAAFAGVKKLSEVTGAIITTDLGNQLRNMGLGAEQIGETAAGFMEREGRLGRSQKLTNDQLIQGTIQYAKELDTLSKLTGLSGDQIRRQQDKALSEGRFRAGIESLRDKGLIDQAKAIEDANSALEVISPQIAQGFRDAQNGLTTDAARMFANTFGAAGENVINGLKTGSLKAVDAVAALSEAAKREKKSRVELGMAIGDETKAYFGVAGISDLANANLGDAAQKIKEAQAAQTAAQDELTRRMNETKKAEETLARQGVQILQSAMSGAAAATAAFAESANKFAEEAIKLAIRLAGVSGFKLPEVARQEAANAAMAAPAAPSTSGTVPNTTPGGAATGATTGGGQLRPRPPVLVPPRDPLANIRPGATAGGDVDPRLMTLAQQVAQMYPGATITALNDTWHQINKPNSKHTQGKALDFALGYMPSREEGESIVQSLKTMGFLSAQDEYNNPSAGSTGGHIHAELAKGGIVSGPTSGYRATLHGTEAVVPLPDGRSIPVQNNSEGSSLVSELLEDLVSAVREQTGMTRKLLQYSS